MNVPSFQSPGIIDKDLIKMLSFDAVDRVGIQAAVKAAALQLFLKKAKPAVHIIRAAGFRSSDWRAVVTLSHPSHSTG
jgi:hypothetical protein